LPILLPLQPRQLWRNTQSMNGRGRESVPGLFQECSLALLTGRRPFANVADVFTKDPVPLPGTNSPGWVRCSRKPTRPADSFGAAGVVGVRSAEVGCVA
jgi:hypothetical protein